MLDLVVEEWRPVTDCEGYYEISNLGAIRRIGRASGAKFMRTLRQNGKREYLSVMMSINNIQVRRDVHRLVAIAFIGPPPHEKSQVNHKDGNKRNNAASNLEWTDSSGNGKHAYAVCGRSKVRCPGEHNGNAKLSELQVSEMRRLKSSLSFTQLAKRFGVSKAQVERIIYRKAWK